MKFLLGLLFLVTSLSTAAQANETVVACQKDEYSVAIVKTEFGLLADVFVSGQLLSESLNVTRVTNAAGAVAYSNGFGFFLSLTPQGGVMRVVGMTSCSDCSHGMLSVENMSCH